jgi:hypothetical protein
MKNQETTLQCPRKRKTGTREAVETAIDLAKQDRSISWEEQMANDPNRISRWEEAKTSPKES